MCLSIKMRLGTPQSVPDPTLEALAGEEAAAKPAVEEGAAVSGECTKYVYYVRCRCMYIYVNTLEKALCEAVQALAAPLAGEEAAAALAAPAAKPATKKSAAAPPPAALCPATPQRSEQNRRECASGSKSKPPGRKRPVPEDLKQKGFSGKTVKAEQCWVCGAVRTEWFRGAACPDCVFEFRRMLGHQRIQELSDNPEQLEEVKALSLKRQGGRSGSKGPQMTGRNVDRLEGLVSRLEAVVRVLPRLEQLVSDVQQLPKRSKR